MARTILVFAQKNFKITIPDGAKVTFGPWSPPVAEQKYGSSDRALIGTLRVYSSLGKTTENILAVFSGVTGFRDLSLGYAEEVAREEGATIWKDDENGYVRENKVSRTRQWVTPLIGPVEETEESE